MSSNESYTEDYSSITTVEQAEEELKNAIKKHGVKNEGSRQPPNKKSSFPRRILLITALLMIPSMYFCINIHSNRLAHTETQLFEQQLLLDSEHEARLMEKMAFNAAYTKLRDEHLLLIKLSKELKEKVQRSGLAETEADNRLQENFVLINENLAEIQQLTNNFIESTKIIEQQGKRYNMLEKQMSALLQFLKEQGINVNFVDESGQPKLPSLETNEGDAPKR